MFEIYEASIYYNSFSIKRNVIVIYYLCKSLVSIVIRHHLCVRGVWKVYSNYSFFLYLILFFCNFAASKMINKLII